MKGRYKQMGGKNFMEAGTEIEGYIEKMDQCLVKISNILAEACITRVKNGKTGSLEKDINNLIESLPAEDQVVILRKLSVILATQMCGREESHNTERRSNNRRNDIFANRSF